MAEETQEQGVSVDTAAPEASSPQETAQESTFDRAALEATTKDRLADVFGGDTDETEETSAEETQEDSADNADNAEVSEDNKDAGTAETTQAAAAETPNAKAPTLPEAYRRSLKAYGWEDADIDQNLKAMGPTFIVTAQKIHQNRNEEVSRWAEAGRAAREQAKGKDAPQAAAFKAIPIPDLAALKEHYGNDALIDSVFGPLKEVVQQINAVVPQIQQSQTQAKMAEVEMLGRQIEGFFTSKPLQPFAELFGDLTKGQLKPDQSELRNKVLEMADALLAGATAQGRRLSFDDAMTLATDSYTGSYKAKAAREEVKTSLKKREKGISLKPGNKATSPAGNPPVVKTRSDLERKVRSKLATVFG